MSLERMQKNATRSQAVARIADCNASTAPLGSHDHFIPHRPFPVGWPLERSLSQAFFKILHFKHIGFTCFTSQGHVTSSVTLPFDTPYTISSW